MDHASRTGVRFKSQHKSNNACPVNIFGGALNVQFSARKVDIYDNQYSMLLCMTTQSSLLERISDIGSLKLMEQPSGPLDMV